MISLLTSTLTIFIDWWKQLFESGASGGGASSNILISQLWILGASDSSIRSTTLFFLILWVLTIYAILGKDWMEFCVFVNVCEVPVCWQGRKQMQLWVNGEEQKLHMAMTHWLWQLIVSIRVCSLLNTSKTCLVCPQKWTFEIIKEYLVCEFLEIIKDLHCLLAAFHCFWEVIFSHVFEKESLSCFMFGIWFADVAGIHVMPVTTTGWQQFQVLVSKGAL